VRLFNEAVDLTGLAITKLDGSAKAGIIFSIAALQDINLPVYFVGVGEGIDDLRQFVADDFVEALLDQDFKDSLERTDA
jgi:fused signal recognition particle receptor